MRAWQAQDHQPKPRNLLHKLTSNKIIFFYDPYIYWCSNKEQRNARVAVLLCVKTSITHLL